MKIPKFALPHRATVIPYLGSTAYGKQWDEAKAKKNVPCLIEPRTQLIQGSNGDDVIKQADAVFHPDYTIRQGDKIQWTKMGLEYIVEIVAPLDAAGPYSIEVVLT